MFHISKFLSFLRGWFHPQEIYSLSDGQCLLLLMLNVSLDCWNLVKNERDRGTNITKVRQGRRDRMKRLRAEKEFNPLATIHCHVKRRGGVLMC